MTRSSPVLFVAVLLTALAAALASVGASSADKNGCPNPNSANGSSHANGASAHGADKQRDRGCAAPTSTDIATPIEIATPTVAPTPEPTPAPTPAPTASPEPTPSPSPEPTATPTPEPTPEPTATATPEPTSGPTPSPAPTPTPVPTLDIEVVSLNLNGATAGLMGIPFQLTGQVDVRNNAPSLAAIVDTTFTPSLPAGCTATTGVVTVQNTPLAAGASAFFSRSWMVTCFETGLKTFGMSATSALDPTVPAIDDNPANNTGVASRDIQIN